MVKPQFMAAGRNVDTNECGLAYSEDGVTWVAIPGFYYCLAVFHIGSTWITCGYAEEGGPLYSSQSYGFWKSGDMVTWEPLGNPGTWRCRLASACRSNEIIVGVGGNFPEDGVCAGYSYDAITWYPTSGISAVDANDVAYGNGRFVVTSGDSVNGFNAWYSTDGINYTQCTGPHTDGYAEYLNDIEWNGSMFIIACLVYGAAAELFYSYDGITFYAQDDYWGTPTTQLRTEAIAYGQGVWVLGGSNYSDWLASSMWYSSDGLSWTACTTPDDFDSYCEHIVYNEILERFVAIGGPDQKILYSDDGITWTKASDNPLEGTSSTNIMALEAAHPGALFVAVGVSASEDDNTIAYTMDGEEWTGLGLDVFDYGCFGVAFNGRMWVAAGWAYDDEEEDANSLAYSYDGIHWNGLGNDIFPTGGNAICWSEELELWVAGGEGTWDGDAIHNMAFSEDGINWTYDTTENPGTYFNGWCARIRWNGTYFLATGNTAWHLYHSYDGKNWIGNDNWYNDTPERPFYDYMSDMLWINSTHWLLGGSDSTYRHNTLGYLTNVVNDWGGYGLSVFTSRCRALCSNGSLIVAGGTPGTQTNIFAHSSDGLTWTGDGQQSIGACRALAFGTDADGEDLWVAGGYGATLRPYEFAYSADGINWASAGVASIYLFDWIEEIAYGVFTSFGGEAVILFGPRVWMM